MNEKANAGAALSEPEKPRVYGRPFTAGNAPRSPGRPRKGQTIADRVAKADAKVAREAIKARDKRLKLENAVGERAWATYLAYNLGLPAQKYIISQGESVADALDARLAALLTPDTPLYIEGESRELP